MRIQDNRMITDVPGNLQLSMCAMHVDPQKLAESFENPKVSMRLIGAYTDTSIGILFFYGEVFLRGKFIGLSCKIEGLTPQQQKSWADQIPALKAGLNLKDPRKSIANHQSGAVH